MWLTGWFTPKIQSTEPAGTTLQGGDIRSHESHTLQRMGLARMTEMVRHAMGEENWSCSNEDTGSSCWAEAPTRQGNMRVWLLKHLLDLSGSQANQQP